MALTHSHFTTSVLGRENETRQTITYVKFLYVQSCETQIGITTNMCIVKCRIFRNVKCLLNGLGPGGASPPPFPESNSVFSPCNNPELRSTACASVAFPGNSRGMGKFPRFRWERVPQSDAHFVEQDSESRINSGLLLGSNLVLNLSP